MAEDYPHEITSTNRALTRYQWRVLFLLALSVYLNLIDRGVLPVAAPALIPEFGFTPTQMGLLFSSVFLTYSFCLATAGWIIDRYSVKWVLGIGVLLWSAATFGTGLIQSFNGLLVMRLLLGIGQAVNYPCIASIVASSFSERNRGFVNGVIDTGTKVGPALVTLGGGFAVAKWGWRLPFFALGSVGILWLVSWLVWAPQHNRAKLSHAPAPSMWQILNRRATWGCFFGHFAASYIYFFLTNWLPTYFVTVKHYSMQTMAVLASLPFWLSAVGAILGGWWSDHLIAGGKSPTFVRRGFAASALLAATLIVPAAMLSSQLATVGLLCVGMFFFGFVGPNLWSITQTLAGPQAAGRWAGAQMSFATLAGVIAPALTGWLVSTTGSFHSAFITAGAVSLGGAASYLFLVGRVEPIRWGSPEEVTVVASGSGR